MKTGFSRILAVVPLLLLLPVYSCFGQSTDYAKSQIGFRSKQMNVPVEGSFGKFTAQVAWNPARPQTSRTEVTVDLASFDIGLDYVNEEAMGKDWFDVNNFPLAKFASAAVKPVGGGRYEAAGKLSMKGITRDVVVVFGVKPEGAGLVFEGSLPIRRLQFRIGEGQWGDTGTVADEVEIRFRIVTAAAQAPRQK
jgi:polyisoprenoid-binding protein YceI